VDPSTLFGNYLYVSGTTQTLRDYFAAFAEDVEHAQGSGLRVLDIASNDGSLLKAFRARGHSVQGVDPATNLVAEAEAAGIPTVNAFWDGAVADELGRFDVIVAMNVLAHVPDPLSFLEAARAALAPGGRAYLQTSQANMFVNHEFDTVYHEHLSYFAVRSFLTLFGRAGLRPIALSKPPVHGTSYLWTCIADDGKAGLPVGVLEMLEEEAAAGWHDFSSYRDFGAVAADRAKWTRETLEGFHADGLRVVGYGAAAKGNTFLNYADIKLTEIFEDNDLKVGRFAPGTLAPIRSSRDIAGITDRLCVLIPAWNFADEIISRVKAIRGQDSPGGDTFVTYFPEGRIVTT
jgi:SAM-dependent methyltransferase